MKKLIPLLFLASYASATFSGYTYERVITISSSNVQSNGGNLTNFPVLVSTNEVSLSTTSGSGGHLSNANGLDLVFSTMSDCSFLLNWDTETVQGVGVSTMNAWVNIPVLTTATLTAATFYMCYGNSSITTYQGVSTKTWDSNYVGVYHLPNGTTLSAKDSTGFFNHGTINTVTAAAGVVDGAASFPGVTGDYVGTPSIDLGVALTVEGWMYPKTQQSNSARLAENGFSTGFFLGQFGGTDAGFWIIKSDFTTTGGHIPLNSWTFAVGTYVSGTSTLYLNGASVSSHGSLLDPTIGSSAISIGDVFAHNDNNSALNGLADEVRFSKIARSADWIKTEYNNQNSPTTFVTIGAETTSALTPTISPQQISIYGGKATINGGNVIMK